MMAPVSPNISSGYEGTSVSWKHMILAACLASLVAVPCHCPVTALAVDTGNSTSTGATSVTVIRAHTGTITVAFDANGGTGTMPAVSAQRGDPYVVPACGFSYAGHEFVAWDGSDGHRYAVGDTVTTEAFSAGATLTLRASWRESSSGDNAEEASNGDNPGGQSHGGEPNAGHPSDGGSPSETAANGSPTRTPTGNDGTSSRGADSSQGGNASGNGRAGSGTTQGGTQGTGSLMQTGDALVLAIGGALTSAGLAAVIIARHRHIA